MSLSPPTVAEWRRMSLGEFPVGNKDGLEELGTASSVARVLAVTLHLNSHKKG